MIYGKSKNEFNRSRKKLRDGNRERERRRERENLNPIFFQDRAISKFFNYGASKFPHYATSAIHIKSCVYDRCISL